MITFILRDPTVFQACQALQKIACRSVPHARSFKNATAVFSHAMDVHTRIETAGKLL